MERVVNRISQLLAKLDQARCCKGKVNYKHMDSALRAAIRMHEKTGSNLEPYACQYCKGFHIGHVLGRNK